MVEDARNKNRNVISVWVWRESQSVCVWKQAMTLIMMWDARAEQVIIICRSHHHHHHLRPHQQRPQQLPNLTKNKPTQPSWHCPVSLELRCPFYSWAFQRAEAELPRFALIWMRCSIEATSQLRYYSKRDQRSLPSCSRNEIQRTTHALDSIIRYIINCIIRSPSFQVVGWPGQPTKKPSNATTSFGSSVVSRNQEKKSWTST